MNYVGAIPVADTLSCLAAVQCSRSDRSSLLSGGKAMHQMRKPYQAPFITVFSISSVSDIND